MITAYLEPTVEPTEEVKILDQIKTVVGSHSETEKPEVKYVGPDQFIKEVSAYYPQLGRELQTLGQDMGQVVPKFISISGIVSPKVIEKVRSVSGIESVDTSKERYKQILGTLIALRWITKALIIGLVLALLTGLMQMARINSSIHQEVMSMMKQWGASPIQIRLPRLLSGMSVGLVGGVLATTAWFLGVGTFAAHVRDFSPLVKTLVAPAPIYGFVFLGIGLFLGLLTSVFGSAQESRG